MKGLGIALLPTQFVGALVESGALVHVLPGIVGAESRIAVVYPEREFLPPHVRAFVDALVAWSPALDRISAPAARGGRRPTRSRAKAPR